MHLQGWPQNHTYLQKQNFAPSPEGLHRIIPKNLKHPQNWTSLCPPQQGEGGPVSLCPGEKRIARCTALGPGAPQTFKASPYPPRAPAALPDPSTPVL